MKRTYRMILSLSALLMFGLLASCRGELPGVHHEEDIDLGGNTSSDSDSEAVTDPDSSEAGAHRIKGFFLLNEGNIDRKSVG